LVGSRQLLISIFEEITIRLQANDMANMVIQAAPRPEISGWLVSEGRLNRYSCSGDKDCSEIPDQSNGNTGMQANRTSSG
jgi:hypothetical protein